MEEAGCDSFKDFLSESEKKDLRKEMEDDRGKKHVGVRKTNLANIGDVSRNCEKIRVMVSHLPMCYLSTNDHKSWRVSGSVAGSSPLPSSPEAISRMQRVPSACTPVEPPTS